jgi:hypothetical protein
VNPITIDELDRWIKYESGHAYLHIRADFIDIDSKSMLEAWNQIKTAITSLEAGIIAPEQCKAEALLLAILSSVSNIHGYTPKEANK